MLKYELTDDDLVAFGFYAATATPLAQKESSRLRIGLSVGVLATLALILAANGLLYLGLGAGLVLAGLLWLLWPRLWRWASRSNARRFASRGQLGAKGEYRIWADDAGVHQISPRGRSDASWADVQRVEDDDEHVYLFTGDIEAYVIPRTVDPAELERFLKTVYRES